MRSGCDIINTYELKAKIRAEMIGKRDAVDPIRVHATNLRGRLLSSLIIEHYHPQHVGAYWPKGREFPTQTCIDVLCQAGIKVFLPVVIGDDMEFYRFSGEEHLSTGPFGVLVPPAKEEELISPKAMDVLIIPGVAFDRQLRRLGHGKGYFDRYITKLPSATPKIGLAYNFQILDQIPHTNADQSVDYLFAESWSTL